MEAVLKFVAENPALGKIPKAAVNTALSSGGSDRGRDRELQAGNVENKSRPNLVAATP